MKQRVSASQKGNLSSTLKNWLPLLQAGLNELEGKLADNLSNNPFCTITKKYEDEYKDPEEEEYEDDEYYKSYELSAKREFKEDLARLASSN